MWCAVPAVTRPPSDISAHGKVEGETMADLPSITDVLAYAEANALLLMEPREVYDACIVGIVQRFTDEFVVYSRAKVLAAMVEMGGDANPEAGDDPDYPPDLAARDYFEFNVVGSWVGEATPGYLEDDLEVGL